MKKTVKRTAVAAMAGVMAASLLTGCGEKKLDGSATVATVNGTEIKMGTVSLAARYQQAQIEAMYLSYFGSATNIWDDAAEEGEESYGDQTVTQIVENLEREELLRQKAADYQVELTEEEENAIAEAAASFMEANTEEAIADLAVTEDDVKTYLELMTYQSKMTDALYEEANVEVTDEEAQQSGFTYISISTDDEELSEDDVAAKKEQAQEILDKIKEDPSADMDEIAKEFDETYSALSGTFDANVSEDEEENSSAYPDEVIEVLRSLEEGQVADELIETEGSIYIVRFDTENDEEATASKKESLKSEKESEYYNGKVDEWMEEAEITVDEKVLKNLKITDKHKYTIQYSADETEEASDDEASSEEVIDEESDEEIIDLDNADAEELEDYGIEEIEAEDAEDVMSEDESADAEELEEPVSEDEGEAVEETEEK
ncbi:MAG: SurA N-terminal domain-containing protein [Blautia sp.]|nr:SurA N-terminal domain-containing protein [Blautia sp.]